MSALQGFGLIELLNNIPELVAPDYATAVADELFSLLTVTDFLQ